MELLINGFAVIGFLFVVIVVYSIYWKRTKGKELDDLLNGRLDDVKKFNEVKEDNHGDGVESEKR